MTLVGISEALERRPPCDSKAGVWQAADDSSESSDQGSDQGSGASGDESD
jgi:hypothetical protein